MSKLTALPYEGIYLIVGNIPVSIGDAYLVGNNFRIVYWNNELEEAFSSDPDLDKPPKIEYQSEDKYPGVPLFKIKWVDCADCEGTGILVDVEFNTECCGYVSEDGYCCNRPVIVPYQVQKECGRCHATGMLDYAQPPSYTVTLGEVFEGVQLIDKYEKI